MLIGLFPQSPVADAPLLDIDLEWDLPDFATIGMKVFFLINTLIIHMYFQDTV